MKVKKHSKLLAETLCFSNIINFVLWSYGNSTFLVTFLLLSFSSSIGKNKFMNNKYNCVDMSCRKSGIFIVMDTAVFICFIHIGVTSNI